MPYLLTIAFLLVASLYAAVGHGGGSGYLATMSLLGISPEVIKPTALSLNVLVASIGTWKYARVGYFSGRLFWPISTMSIPFAFIGGRLELPTTIYRPVVGLVLLYAAFRLWRSTKRVDQPVRQTTLPVWLALLAGMVIGLVSGLVGVGGGIFLGPLLLLAGWADTRQAMGITTAFVLVNSISGLLGHISTMESLPATIPLWLLAVGIGGWIGAEYGSKKINSSHLRLLLALMLTVGGLRMVIN